MPTEDGTTRARRCQTVSLFHGFPSGFCKISDVFSGGTDSLSFSSFFGFNDDESTSFWLRLTLIVLWRLSKFWFFPSLESGLIAPDSTAVKDGPGNWTASDCAISEIRETCCRGAGCEQAICFHFWPSLTVTNSGGSRHTKDIPVLRGRRKTPSAGIILEFGRREFVDGANWRFLGNTTTIKLNGNIFQPSAD